jgi:hypothetical protein
MTSRIVVRLRDGTTVATDAPSRRFTDKLLAAKYNGAQLTVNDRLIALTDIDRIEWPTEGSPE